MSALGGVEGLAAVQRVDGGLGDEVGRRQVAFADPQRHQPLTAAPVVEHFDDAAFRRGERLGTGRREKAGGNGVCTRHGKALARRSGFSD